MLQAAIKKCRTNCNEEREAREDFLNTAFAWMGTIFVLIWRRHV